MQIDLLIFAVVLVIVFGLSLQIIITRKKKLIPDPRRMEIIKYLGQISLALSVILQALEWTNVLDGLQPGGVVTMEKIAASLGSSMDVIIRGLLVYILAMIAFLVLRASESKKSARVQ